MWPLVGGKFFSIKKNKNKIIIYRLKYINISLGNGYQVYKAKSFKKPPKYYHSVHGVGRMRSNPKGKRLNEDGVTFYTGN